MKKKQSIITLVVIFVLTVLLGYTVAVGWGATGVGAMKNIRTGLDLSGGVSITYEASEANPSAEDMTDTIGKLQKRVEQYSNEALVYQQGDNRISIEIPGASDANTILEELGKPGSLTFQDASGNVVLEGTDIADAQGVAQQNSTTGQNQYVVNLTLNDSGKDKFAEATAANIGKPISIIYDGNTISSPTVNSTISDGKCEITGMSSIDAAKELASTIRIGSLSLELNELYSNVVAAQLGQDALSSSVVAGMIGILLVIIFLICVYRIPGVAAGWALIIYTGLMLGALNAFDLTLTLPGIAGIILSIGMAVDANVIIYARIREEITAGKSIKNAIAAGFQKAFSAILDGNVTTLIAAAILYALGSGSIRGFAMTLALGIVLSMFTALVISRLLINALFAAGCKAEKLYGRQKERKLIDFVGKKKFFFIFSFVLILSLPAGLILHQVKDGQALNYSLEFIGGTSTTVAFSEDYSMSKLDSDVQPVVQGVTGDANIMFQKVVDSDSVIIKTRELSVEERQSLDTALIEKFGVTQEDITAENISATMSDEMTRDAVFAVTISVIFMLVYIWLRFKDIRFASSAIIALIHDIIIVIAFYAWFRFSAGSSFIAVLLTILGYSINGTIVIFDRIRENLPSMKKEDLSVVVNTSITQTLTRSIYSSLTTFATIFVLYLMGVPSVKEFSLPIIIGIVTGTYTSVCLTGSMWYVFKKKLGKKKVPEKIVASKNKTKK
ncbi:MAG: protein translocase subunit SecD [Lachnospiraceae bacterium]|nr:protein translocase subunit SecD [Lachnospiraceae bacterium]